MQKHKVTKWQSCFIYNTKFNFPFLILLTTKNWEPKIERLEQKISLLEVKIKEIQKSGKLESESFS